MRQSDLSLLNTVFRTRLLNLLYVLRFYALSAEEQKHVVIRVLETGRTQKRQRDLRKSGASKVNLGWHNVGLATDIGVLIDGAYQTDDAKGYYLRFGLLAMAFGFRWGGNWDQDKNIGEGGENDLGHVEYHPGFTLAQYIAAQKAGKELLV